jgi:catechol 2,3-dioxygenase-like lactoylglutathione lyase family enzyme
MEKIIQRLLGDYEQGRLTRRQLIRSLAIVTGVAPALQAEEKPVVKALYVNHISYRVADYAKTRDFYSSLLGMKVSDDDGQQCRLSVGDSLIFPRTWPARTPQIDHICYTVADWDVDKNVFKDSLQEFKTRGIVRRVGTNSFHISDPDGFEVQIGGKDP